MERSQCLLSSTKYISNEIMTVDGLNLVDSIYNVVLLING